MSSNPYENEPGFDDAKSESDKLNMEQYKCKVSVPILRSGSRLIINIFSRFATRPFGLQLFSL
jgi:hypothetical protein